MQLENEVRRNEIRYVMTTGNFFAQGQEILFCLGKKRRNFFFNFYLHDKISNCKKDTINQAIGVKNLIPLKGIRQP